MLGITWGPAMSASTYSGVPHLLFADLADRGRLAGVLDAKQVRPADVATGLLDWRRTISARRPRVHALWRFLPESIDRLSTRSRRLQGAAPDHDTVLQFGVAGLPDPAVPLVAHVEISVETALGADHFASTYGFAGVPDRLATRAIEGERRFLDACTLVWTNSTWTAEGLRRQGVGDDRLRICPPGCGMPDPGTVVRDWSRASILFVGKFWESKGGDLLLEAFRDLRRRRPDSTLTIIGCEPEVSEPGVEVLGFLDKGSTRDAAAIDRAFRRATVFCMPSHWESIGIVYMEAALYGLPVVMLAGQGREAVFPASMAVHVAWPDAELLSQELDSLTSDPERMQRLGADGRARVLAELTWPAVGRRVSGFVDEARALGARTGR